MARHFRGSGHILRFIEYMEVGTTNGWRMDDALSAAEIVSMVDAELPLEPVDPNYRGEVANRWRYRDGAGEIGVIASVTQTFCRELHQGPAVIRRLALHLPVRHQGP
jgi:cyclic pyranopterin phosphate synthase